MSLDTLRMIVGFTIILSHLVSFSLILFGTDKLLSNERMELSLLISPVFAVYVAAIVRQFLRQNAAFDNSPTHPALRILSIGSACLFGLAIPVIVFEFSVGRIGDFPMLKNTLGLVETALGLYTGAVVDRLFSSEKSRRKSTARQ